LALPGGLQLRAGLFLTRFGRLNATHPHSWSFVDQPVVLGRFLGGEGSGGLGAEVSWLTPLPWYLELVASAGQADGQRSFLGDDAPPLQSPADLLYTVAVKQFFPIDADWSLMWGLSGQFGPNASAAGARTEIYGTDLYLRYRPVGDAERSAVSLQIEALLRSRDVGAAVLRDWGAYAHLVWRIDPTWEIGGRYDYVRALAGDPLDPAESGHRHRAQLEASWTPSHFARIRLQGTADLPQWRPQPIFAAVLALELLIGAHGAHTF
jgi:hypothetical protein